MLIPQDVLDNIRESNDIVDVIAEYVSLQRKGNNYVGLCPFHKEKTPSFNVRQDKQTYHCFGCGEGGNVFTFIMKHRNLDFLDAARMLAERANILITHSTDNADKEYLELREKLFNINKEAARFFLMRLQNSGTGFEYLKKRGIGVDIIKRFGLGYSPDSWDALYKHMKSKGYSDEIMEKSGLIIKKNTSGYYDRFRNRVMFPVFDVKGRVIGFGGRVLDDSKPKYLNSPETLVFNKGKNLYGLNFAISVKDIKKIIIVEGYMDVIALHQYGISYAVASLGTALTREQGKLLKRYSDEILICYDSDTAGQAATLRGLDILSEIGCNVRIITIPKAKDPDEYIRLEGREAFEKCIEDAMPLVEYKIRSKIKNYDVTTTEGKIKFLKSCAESMAEIDDPVVLDAYISKLSEETAVSSTALYEEISRQKKSGSREQQDPEKHISGKSRYNNNVDGQKLYLEPAYIKAEKCILHLLYENDGYFDMIAKTLACDDFNDIVYRKVACIIYEKIKSKEEIVPASIINSFGDVDEMRKASELFNIKIHIDPDNINDMITDCINLIQKSKLIDRRNTLMSEIKECEKTGNLEKSAVLLKEVIEVEKQLRIR